MCCVRSLWFLVFLSLDFFPFLACSLARKYVIWWHWQISVRWTAVMFQLLWGKCRFWGQLLDRVAFRSQHQDIKLNSQATSWRWEMRKVKAALQDLNNFLGFIRGKRCRFTLLRFFSFSSSSELSDIEKWCFRLGPDVEEIKGQITQHNVLWYPISRNVCSL